MLRQLCDACLVPELARCRFVERDPNAAQMQKIMTFMPILFGVMLYNYAAGLSLYMITSSLIGIIEAKYIKKKWPVGGTPPSDAVTG